MNYVFLFLILGIFGFFLGKFIKHRSLYPFMPFRYDFRKRRDTFKRTLELLEKTNAKVIVETGTSRHGLKGAKSNGAATIVFGKWAQRNKAELHSVDISEESIYHSRQEVIRQRLEDTVTLHLSDSVAFLRGFERPIDLLYLDSYDYSDTDTEIQQKSQQHHLDEFKAIEHRLHKNTIVLIDDCNLPNGGKGKLLVAYMLTKNWKIVMNAYQILLVDKDFVL